MTEAFQGWVCPCCGHSYPAVCVHCGQPEETPEKPKVLAEGRVYVAELLDGYVVSFFFNSEEPIKDGTPAWAVILKGEQP